MMHPPSFSCVRGLLAHWQSRSRSLAEPRTGADGEKLTLFPAAQRQRLAASRCVA
jgi:hypothetical protein